MKKAVKTLKDMESSKSKSAIKRKKKIKKVKSDICCAICGKCFSGEIEKDMHETECEIEMYASVNP